MSELFANHWEGRVELITLQDNEARGKKFVGARGFNKLDTYCIY